MTGETTGGRGADGCRSKNQHTTKEGVQVPVCSSVCPFYMGFLFRTSKQMRRYTDLPVGALSPHCIFPVRNDVGSVVRDDVVVILSIWGKGLGGTGHLGL